MKGTEKSNSPLQHTALPLPSATITAREVTKSVLAATVETAVRVGARFCNRAIARVLLGVVLSQLCTGCLVVPVPSSGRKVTANWKAEASVLQSSHATREEVSCQLGTPDWDFQDLQVIGYQWSGVEWSVFWLLSGGYNADAGICEPTSHRLLWLAFDEEDRLRQAQVVTRSIHKTSWEQALRWRQRLDPPLAVIPPTQFSPLLPLTNQAVVHVLWDKGTSYSPVGSVRIDGQDRAQIRKGCFTTFVLEPGHHHLVLLNGRLELDLAANEVYFLDFHPKRAGSTAEGTLFECPETEALTRLQQLHFCR